MDYDWSKPQTLQHIKGAMNSYGGVLHELFPTDWTYIALMKTLNRYRWISRCPSDEFKRAIITEYFNNVMKANAVRAGQGAPPLSYVEHVAKLVVAMEEYGVDTRVPTITGMEIEHNTAGGSQQASNNAPQFGQGCGRGGRGGRGAGASQRGGRGGGRGGGRVATFNGKGVCRDYNDSTKQCQRAPSGVGCKDEAGNWLAHVCNIYNKPAAKYCLAKHPRYEHPAA